MAKTTKIKHDAHHPGILRPNLDQLPPQRLVAFIQFLILATERYHRPLELLDHILLPLSGFARRDAILFKAFATFEGLGSLVVVVGVGAIGVLVVGCHG